MDRHVGLALPAVALALLPHTTAAPPRWPPSTTSASTGARTSTDADRPLRHALEVRHEIFRDPAFIELLHQHDVVLVVADSAGTWPYIEQTTASFAYVRLHGGTSCTTRATPPTRSTGGR